jgi:hypothetical protein
MRGRPAGCAGVRPAATSRSRATDAPVTDVPVNGKHENVRVDPTSRGIPRGETRPPAPTCLHATDGVTTPCPTIPSVAPGSVRPAPGHAVGEPERGVGPAVVCRFHGEEEIAAALRVTVRTVQRDRVEAPVSLPRAPAG